MATSKSSGMNAEINVTPFLDILLVLLIIFLASMTTRRSLDAQLPIPCALGCAGDSRSIVLEVLSNDRFLLNRQPVEAAQLPAAIRAAYADRPDKVLQVAGHRDASYQTVLSAMDVARSSGVRVISIPPSDTASAK